MSTSGGPLPLRCLDPGEQNSKFLKFYGLSLVFWYWHQKRLLAWKTLRMPTSLGQCYHTKIFLSKEMADSMCPDKKGFLFGIGRFILIAGNIVLVVVVKLLAYFFPSCFWKRHLFLYCISYVAITHCPALLDVCNQQRTSDSAHYRNKSYLYYI